MKGIFLGTIMDANKTREQIRFLNIAIYVYSYITLQRFPFYLKDVVSIAKIHIVQFLTRLIRKKN